MRVKCFRKLVPDMFIFVGYMCAVLHKNFMHKYVSANIWAIYNPVSPTTKLVAVLVVDWPLYGSYHLWVLVGYP